MPTARRLLSRLSHRLRGQPRPTAQMRPAPENRPSGAYEKTWRGRLELIQQVIDDGETRLPAVLATVVRRLEEGKGWGVEPAPYLAYNTTIDLPPRAAQRLHRGLVVDTVLGMCSDRTASIVELGSGWGEHLCNIWCEGGPTHATYYACEIAEFGRRCAETLASLDQGLHLESPHFDYLHPEFPTIPRPQDDVVVYTVHSVEQVEELPAEFVSTLCALGDNVRAMHIEPIGWQMYEESKKNAVTLRHQARCTEKNYNKNLWRLLKRAEAEGLIAIDCAIPNLFGTDYNPASYILWSKRI